MLTEYFDAAMRHARYETMEDGTIWGEIAETPGVWATGTTWEECERQLHSALEDWTIITLHDGDQLPIIDGIDINALATI